MELQDMSLILPIAILLLSLNLLWPGSAMAATFGNETDRLALLAFKDQITDDPLQVLNLWNDSHHFCEWRGVMCSLRHQRVTVLDLQSQRLVGSITPSIGNLTFLKEINLGDYNFYGVIPSEISHLFRLQYLRLTQNSFRGEIPISLTNCSNLRIIHLNFNKLVGRIPQELSTLPKLVALHAAANNLTGCIPPSFGNLSSLSNLSLARNNLEGSIPADLGQLTSLKFLQFGANKLSGKIPSPLYNLSSIDIFALADNQLQGSLPPDLGLTLPNLQLLAIGINQFSGPIPISLSNASGLLQLDLPDNNFVGPVPINLGSLQGLKSLNIGRNSLGSGEADDLHFLKSLINNSNLEMLGLDNNHFGGVLPNSIANLSIQLRTLLVGGNQISESIPSAIGNLINLRSLDVARNFLTGNIPTGIGKLHRLEQLFMNGNGLSGKIPPFLGNITQLFELRLDKNNLEGSIPLNLGNCRHLQVLDLSQNNLNGTIPKQVIGLSALSISLNLAQNSFDGFLPSQVGNLINLMVLDVSENKLSGNIPNTLGNCLSLEHLYMGGNFFQGNIPQSLSTLRGIQDLDLSHNNLSGQIPKFLQDFVFLQYLNLSSNNLDGEVPTEGFFSNVSASLISGNSKLCGGISKLQLPSCPIQESKKKGRSTTFKVVIATISVVLCFSLILCSLTVYRIRKSRKKPLPVSSLDDHYSKISYRDLHKATGGFSPKNLIGVGSYGSVYKGVLNQDETVIAVKVLNLHQRGASKSYMAECNTLRSIRHRNLVKILTSCSSVDFEGNDFKALVFELMPNGSLEKWLHPELDEEDQSRKLNILQRLNIAIDVASALDYLHHHCQTPIVHCDLKPSNVLLDNEMCAHVSDFGLARFLSEHTSTFSQNQTSSIAIRGSVGYVAPESGMSGRVTPYGDVYSYGILLLEMFTGKIPTDDMFNDGLSLHKFAKTVVPKQVMEIVDPTLLLQEEEEDDVKARSDRRDKVEQCLTSVVRIGIACSVELPRDRMDMKDVTRGLHMIRDKFLEVGVYRKRPNMA